MVGHAAAVVVVMILTPAPLFAQTMELSVRVQSATIHKGPSTGSPVIGRAPRGTVLEVTRDLGTWVKVVWPDAEDGVGYVHERMGSIARRATREERLAAALQSPPGTTPAAASRPASPASGSSAPAPNPRSDPQMTATRATYVVPPTHFVGFGGRMGRAPVDFGATARLWSRQRFGVQVEVLRSAQTSVESPGRVTTLEFAPSLIYMLRDHVTSNFWVRPYAGTGASLRRSSFKLTPDTGDPVTDSSLGFRAFGGAEVTFPNVPRFAVSADLGYLWADTPFVGFDPGGVRFSVSGHWYVR